MFTELLLRNGHCIFAYHAAVAIQYFPINGQVMEDEISRTYRTHWREEECVGLYGLDGKSRRKET
jgi:hypothetical protein